MARGRRRVNAPGAVLYSSHMQLETERKFLEGTWWIWPLGLFLLHLLFWALLGWRLNPAFSFWSGLWASRQIMSMFLAAAFLPFIAARFGLKRLFWAGVVGLALGFATYYGLSLLGFGSKYSLLPFISFMQMYISCIGLGVVVEFGRYVFRKVTE